MNKSKGVNWLNILKVLSVFLVYALIGLVFFLLSRLFGFTIEDLRTLLFDLGIGGYILFVLLQVLTNVFLFIIPGQTLQFIALGLTLFNPLTTFILVVIGTVLASLINFLIGRLLGQQFVVKIIGKKTYDKYQKRLASKAYVYYPVMMLLPFFPDDEVTLLVGLTRMNLLYFLFTTVLTRAVGIAIFTFLPGQIIFSYRDTLELVLLIIGIVYVALLTLYLIRQIEKFVTKFIA